MEELNLRAKKFAEGLEQVRLELVADPSASLSLLAYKPEQISALDRILSAIGGLAFGNIGGAIAGGSLGHKEMLKSIIPQTMMYVATVIFLGWNPIVLGTILATTLVQGILKMTSITKKIRDAVGKEYTDRFREARYQMANTITYSVDKKIQDLQEALDQGLGLEIQNIRDQVNSVIAEKQQGQEKVNQAIRRLEAMPDELDALESAIDALVECVILSNKKDV